MRFTFHSTRKSRFWRLEEYGIFDAMQRADPKLCPTAPTAWGKLIALVQVSGFEQGEGVLHPWQCAYLYCETLCARLEALCQDTEPSAKPCAPNAFD